MAIFNLVIPRCSAMEVTLVACPESYRRVPPLENPPTPPLQRGARGDFAFRFSIEYPATCGWDYFFLSPQCGGGRGEGEGG